MGVSQSPIHLENSELSFDFFFFLRKLCSELLSLAPLSLRTSSDWLLGHAPLPLEAHSSAWVALVSFLQPRRPSSHFSLTLLFCNTVTRSPLNKKQLQNWQQFQTSACARVHRELGLGDEAICLERGLVCVLGFDHASPQVFASCLPRWNVGSLKMWPSLPEALNCALLHLRLERFPCTE